MRRANKKEVKLRDKVVNLPESETITKMAKIMVRHLSPSEKEDFRELATMALFIELEEQKKEYAALYDQHLELMGKYDTLSAKLKRVTKRK